MKFTLIMIFSDTCYFCESFLETYYNELCDKLSKESDTNIFTIFIKSSQDKIISQIHPDLCTMIQKIGAVPLFMFIPTNQLFNSDETLTSNPYGWILFDNKYQQINDVKYDVENIFKWTTKMKNLMSNVVNGQNNSQVNIIPYKM